MAKLSAYGRTEIYRVTKDNTKYALMSDGAILVNHGYGWKNAARLPRFAEPEASAEWLRNALANGYRQVRR